MVLPHILKYWCNHPKKLRIALQHRLSSLVRFTKSLRFYHAYSISHNFIRNPFSS